MLNVLKIILVFTFVIKSFLSVAQDKIYKKGGGIITCKVTDVLDEKVFYKLLEKDARTTEIYKSEIDIIRYESGKIDDYSSIGAKPELKKEDKFDRNSEEFVNYANSLARQMSESIILKMAGKVENSSVAVYFDSVYKDMMTGDLNIPIKITYEKYNAMNNGYIKGTIQVKKNGKKVWIFENSGKE